MWTQLISGERELEFATPFIAGNEINSTNFKFKPQAYVRFRFSVRYNEKFSYTIPSSSKKTWTGSTNFGIVLKNHRNINSI